MKELFICGNPRLLSGGTIATMTNYESDPTTIEKTSSPVLCTNTLTKDRNPRECAEQFGQLIHKGKGGYHSNHAYNVFLRDKEWPSAGVEIETHLKQFTFTFAESAMQDLYSNWFHFERDGSLDHAHGGEYGFELITAPLPPRAYRNIELWKGLQNLCSPYLESFNCKETGLHVHVGLNQFQDFDQIPLTAPQDRRGIGKLLTAVVYYSIVDPTFIDRVMLRRVTTYCNVESVPEFTNASKLILSGRATGAALVDYCTACLSRRKALEWARLAQSSEPSKNRVWTGDSGLTTGHSTELNGAHHFTIEFRRAKGTLHALSVHRIVELTTSIVRYAGKICREPDLVVTKNSFMEWLEATTTSEALKSLIKQMKG